MDKIEQKFLGVWELDEWVVEKPNGDKTFPFSGNVDGFLIYHSEGWMSATLMQKNRTDVSNDRSKIAKISKKWQIYLITIITIFMRQSNMTKQ